MELLETTLLPAGSKAASVNCDRGLDGGGGGEGGGGVDATQVSVPGSPPASLFKLRDRRLLLQDKQRLCTWAVGAAVLGILLMIVHAELCPAVYVANSVYSFSVKAMISLSTGCLLILVVAFHYKDVRLFMIDHNLEDWRIAMTTQRVLVIALELAVCAVHPLPGALGVGSGSGGAVGLEEGNFSSAPLCSASGPQDALLDLELLLSCLMFLRLYLVHRAILLHSKVLLSASYRSIGSLNNINFTFRFVLKVLMNTYPARTLLFFILFLWLSASWLLTLCERQIREETGRMDNALWLVAITFLTVGYGDLSPKTTCGRAVCLFTGVMGVGCTAMLVAVLTKKLSLNKGEKHVHQFMLDIQVSKEIQVAAANVLRECWLLHRSNRSKRQGLENRQRQRHLLEAIRIFRYVRLRQRKLRDHANEMVDLSKLQVIMCDLNANWNKSYRDLEQRIIAMERKMDELGQAFQHTSSLLAQAVQHRTSSNSFK